jgi:uncharacterized membrane protein
MQAFKNFRTCFVRGLAALLPTILTIWIFVQCYIFIQSKVGIHVNRGLVWPIGRLSGANVAHASYGLRHYDSEGGKHRLDVTIEEAMRFTISGGVITPAKHQAFRALVNKQDGEHV